jgi:hypothetical protein
MGRAEKTPSHLLAPHRVQRIRRIPGYGAQMVGSSSNPCTRTKRAQSCPAMRRGGQTPQEARSRLCGARAGTAQPPRLPELLVVTRRVLVRGAIMIGGRRSRSAWRTRAGPSRSPWNLTPTRSSPRPASPSPRRGPPAATSAAQSIQLRLMEKSPERPVLTIGQVFDPADAIAPCYRALILLAVFRSLRWGELAIGRAAGTRGRRCILSALAESAITSLSRHFVVERVTRIELAQSAWEVQRSRPLEVRASRHR